MLTGKLTAGDMCGELDVPPPLTLSTSFKGRCSGAGVVAVKLWLLSSPAPTDPIECLRSLCFLCFLELPILIEGMDWNLINQSSSKWNKKRKQCDGRRRRWPTAKRVDRECVEWRFTHLSTHIRTRTHIAWSIRTHRLFDQSNRSIESKIVWIQAIEPNSSENGHTGATEMAVKPKGRTKTWM